MKGVEWLQAKEHFESRIFLLFDFVSYSMKASSEQNWLVLKFSRLIEGLVNDGGIDCIKIPIGDGMILGFLPDANIILFLNQFFSKLKEYNNVAPESHRFNIRTAMHYGAVYEYTDINGNLNYAGDGINIVARIGSRTDSKQVIISEACYQHLCQSGRIVAENVSEVFDINVKHNVIIKVRNYRDHSERIGIPLQVYNDKIM